MEQYLFASDFDGTIARTFEQAPSGVGVNESYRLAVEDLFGEIGLGIYDKQAGLRNRAPSELVFDLLSEDPEQVGELLSQAWTFFKCEEVTLKGFVPEGKGYSLNGSQENLRPENLLAEVLTRQKLVYLQDQIGQPMEGGGVWPRLTPGFGDFWKGLQQLKEAGVPLSTAVISSGHELFIKKTFKAHGLEQPDVLVTEDDIRGKNFPNGKLLVKPNPYPFALAHRKLNKLGVEVDKSRIVYFGDDLVKDGQMAVRSRVAFGLVTPNLNGVSLGPNQFAFTDWRSIAPDVLNVESLKAGRSIIDMVTG